MQVNKAAMCRIIETFPGVLADTSRLCNSMFSCNPQL